MAHGETDVVPDTQPHAGMAACEGEESRRIKAEIDSTRKAMDHTINELADRLTPRQMMHEFIDLFRGSGGDGSMAGRQVRRLGRSVLQQAKNHPAPAALVTAGIIWMMMEGDERDRAARSHAQQPEGPGLWESAAGKASGVASSAAEKARHAAERARLAASGVTESARHVAESARHSALQMKERAAQRLQQVGGRVQGAAVNLGHTASQSYRQAREKTSMAIEEYPLSACVASLAAGVLVGFALPRTRMEDSLYGQRAQELKDRARDMGREALDRGKEVSATLVDVAKRQAEEQGLTPQAIGEKVKQAAHAVKETAKQEVGGPAGQKDGNQGTQQQCRQPGVDQPAGGGEPF